jgi:hypothetical protein
MLLEEPNGRTNDWFVMLSNNFHANDPILFQKEIATIHFTFESNVIIDGIEF